MATDMPCAIFTHPLLAEGLNTLFAMFDDREDYVFESAADGTGQDLAARDDPFV